MHGTTCENIEQMLDMRHQTASARRTDLRTAGYTDYLRDDAGNPIERLTTSGSPAKVEVATQRGKDAIEFNLPLVFKTGDPTRGHHGDDLSSAAAFKRTGRINDAYRVLKCMVKFS
jgi:hypothetical protein